MIVGKIIFGVHRSIPVHSFIPSPSCRPCSYRSRSLLRHLWLISRFLPRTLRSLLGTVAYTWRYYLAWSPPFSTHMTIIHPLSIFRPSPLAFLCKKAPKSDIPTTRPEVNPTLTYLQCQRSLRIIKHCQLLVSQYRLFFETVPIT